MDGESSKNTCSFPHDNIDRLFGVKPQPIEDLPKVCTCGERITYANPVAFVEQANPTWDDSQLSEYAWVSLGQIVTGGYFSTPTSIEGHRVVAGGSYSTSKKEPT